MSKNLKVVIPMAGLGTRLRPHTWSKPKQLISVAGKAVLDHVLDTLGSLPDLQEIELVAIVGYLGEVGINVTLDLMESGQYWDLEAAKELPPLFGDSWSASSGEALRRLTGALGGMDASYSSWSDPVIDDLLAKISTTVDRDERKALYEELQVYMQENPPFIYLYEPVAFEAVQDRVMDYKPHSQESYWLYETWVEVDE